MDIPAVSGGRGLALSVLSPCGGLQFCYLANTMDTFADKKSAIARGWRTLDCKSGDLSLHAVCYYTVLCLLRKTLLARKLGTLTTSMG